MTVSTVISAALRANLAEMDVPFSSQSDAYLDGGSDALAALAATSYVMVQLPDPDGTEEDPNEHATYWSGPCAPHSCAVVRVKGTKEFNPGISLRFPEWITDPAMARALAKALFAAAADLEGDQEHPYRITAHTPGCAERLR